jgi:hypothetical protein
MRRNDYIHNMRIVDYGDCDPNSNGIPDIPFEDSQKFMKAATSNKMIEFFIYINDLFGRLDLSLNKSLFFISYCGFHYFWQNFYKMGGFNLK